MDETSEGLLAHSVRDERDLGWRRSLIAWSRGEVREAIAAASEVHGQALAAGDLRAARMAAVNLARFVLNLGHPAWAGRILDQVDEMVVEGDEPASGTEVTLTAVVRGRIAELRGDPARAEAILLEAAARLEADGDLFFRDSVRLAWATTMAMLSPQSAQQVVDEMTELRATCEHDGLSRLSGIGLGLAVGYLGDGDAGAAHVEDALAVFDLPADVAQVLVRLGEMHLHLRDGERAAVAFEQALELLDVVGGSYWAARALCGLARGGAPDAAALRSRARLLSDGDPAFDRLFAADAGLAVRLVGDVGVRRADVPLDFAGRQAEFVVLALVAVAPSAIDLDDLVDLLWPSPDPRRLPQRVRTLLWQVRRALGPDAWRLGRDGDGLRLDVRGIEVVGADDPEEMLEGWPHVAARHRTWLRDRVRAARAEPI